MMSHIHRLVRAIYYFTAYIYCYVCNIMRGASYL